MGPPSHRYPNIGSYFAIFLGLWALWRGKYLLSGGPMARDSMERRRALADVNLVRRLRGLPRQKEVTREQMRAYGWVYVVFGAIGVVGGVLTAAGVLH